MALLGHVIPCTATLADLSEPHMHVQGQADCLLQECLCQAGCKAQRIVRWLSSFSLFAEVWQHPGCCEPGSHQRQNETETVPKHLILALLHSCLQGVCLSAPRDRDSR